MSLNMSCNFLMFTKRGYFTKNNKMIMIISYCRIDENVALGNSLLTKK